VGVGKNNKSLVILFIGDNINPGIFLNPFNGYYFLYDNSIFINLGLYLRKLHGLKIKSSLSQICR
jgi:hypothetical protein